VIYFCQFIPVPTRRIHSLMGSTYHLCVHSTLRPPVPLAPFHSSDISDAGATHGRSFSPACPGSCPGSASSCRRAYLVWLGLNSWLMGCLPRLKTSAQQTDCLYPLDQVAKRPTLVATSALIDRSSRRPTVRSIVPSRTVSLAGSYAGDRWHGG
jgi:hypothetical protein